MDKLDPISLEVSESEKQFDEMLLYCRKLMDAIYKITPKQVGGKIPMEKTKYEALKRLETKVKEGKADFHERNVYNIIQKKKRKKQPITFNNGKEN